MLSANVSSQTSHKGRTSNTSSSTYSSLSFGRHNHTTSRLASPQDAGPSTLPVKWPGHGHFAFNHTTPGQHHPPSGSPRPPTFPPQPPSLRHRARFAPNDVPTPYQSLPASPQGRARSKSSRGSDTSTSSFVSLSSSGSSRSRGGSKSSVRSISSTLSSRGGGRPTRNVRRSPQRLDTSQRGGVPEPAPAPVSPVPEITSPPSPPAARTEPRVLGYTFRGEVVYVPFGRTYDDAVALARGAFPSLEDVDPAFLSLCIEHPQNGGLRARISRDAWTEIADTLPAFTAVDVDVREVVPTGKAGGIGRSNSVLGRMRRVFRRSTR